MMLGRKSEELLSLRSTLAISDNEVMARTRSSFSSVSRAEIR